MDATPKHGTVQRLAICAACGIQILHVPDLGWVHHPSLRKECR
jgi:hypothetical protein